MSSQWECLAQKKVGDDVSGSFLSNAGSNRFNGIADFADDMLFYTGDQAKFDANWITLDSINMRGNPSTNVIDWIEQEDNTTDIIYFDLWSHGIFPGTTWTLRGKLDLTTVLFTSGDNHYMTFGMSSDLNDISLTDGVFYWWRGGTVNPFNKIIASSGRTLAQWIGDSTQFARQTQLGIVYVEIKQTSPTTAEITLYSDADYSVIIEKQRNVSAGGTLPPFRYIAMKNEQILSASASQSAGTLTDIQFFNNTEGIVSYSPASNLGRSLLLHADEDLDPAIVASADFTDDFVYPDQPTADASWVPQVLNQRVNIITDVLDFVTRRDGVDNRVTHDLGVGNVSNTQWTLRCKYHVDTIVQTGSVGSGTLLQIQDTDVDQNSQNDMIGFGIQNNVGVAGIRWLLLGKNGGVTSGIDDSGNNSVPLTATDYWIEITRLDDVNVNAKVFTDSNYSDLLHDLNIVTNPANINLRYLILSSASDVTAWNGTLTGFIDDLEFFNGITEVRTGNILNEDFSTYGSPLPADFTDVFDSATGWITTDSTRVRIEDDQGFLFYMGVRDGTNDQIAFDLGNQLFSTPIFTEDFSYTSQSLADASWGSTDVARLDPFPNELTWKIFAGGGTQETIGHDLGFTLPDDKFRLRFKVRTDTITIPNASGIRYIFGLSSIAGGDANTSQDFIGLHASVSSGAQTYGTIWSNGTGIGTQVLMSETVAVNTRYIEIIRDDATNFTINIYSDANYTILVSTQTGIPTAGLTGLRYLKVYTTFQGTNVFEGAFDDIELLSPVVNDTEWLLRFKYVQTELTTPTGDNIVCYVSLDDKDQTVGKISNHDAIVFEAVRTTGGASLFRVRGINNAPYTSVNVTSFITPLAIGTWYVSLRRISSSLAECSLYADENYSDLIEKQTVALAVGLGSLRYLTVANLNSSNANGSFEATVDDVSFWNGRIASCDPVTTTFTDDFSYASQLLADIAWPSTDLARFDPFPNEMVWNIAGAVEDAIYHDMGFPLDGNFRIRAKIDLQNISSVSALGKGLYWGISSITGVRTVLQDFIGLAFFVDSDVADQKIRLQWTNNQIPGTNQVDIRTSTDVQIYYVEILRTSPTAITINIYSDAGYTTLTDTASAVMTANVNNLRYLKAYSGASAGGANTMDGVIDDIEVLYNTSSVWITTQPIGDFARLDICQENILYSSSAVTEIRNIGFDLGTPLSDEKWVLRFKMTFNKFTSFNNGPCFWLGFSESPVEISSQVSQNHMGISILQSTGFKIFAGQNGTGPIFICSSTEPTNQTFNPVIAQGDVVYWEVIRLANNTLQITRFADPEYTYPVQSATATVTTGPPEDIIGLRYLKLVNKQNSLFVTPQPQLYTIDDIKVWDGVDVADGFGRRNLQLLVHKVSNDQGPIIGSLAFRANLDAGLNYSWRRSIDGGADFTLGNTNLVQWFITGSEIDEFVETVFYNTIKDELLGITHVTDNVGLGAGSVPRRLEFVEKWANTITNLSRVELFDETNFPPPDGRFDTDTEAIVFGSD